MREVVRIPHNYADFEDALEREEIEEEEYLSYFRDKRDAFTDFYLNDETLDMYVLEELREVEHEEGGEEREPMGEFKYLEKV